MTAPDIDALVKELDAGLEGVTPGPWKILGDGHDCWVIDAVGSSLQHGHDGEMDEPDAAHIARCSPENIRALLDALASISAERDALQFALDTEIVGSGYLTAKVERIEASATTLEAENKALRVELERVKVEYDELRMMYVNQGLSAFKPWREQKARALAAESALSERTRALERIERWFGEFPETGEFWDKEKTKPISYEAQYGSYGERDFMRGIARRALSAPNQGGQMMKLCDCERSHNGLGLAGRECDCPAIEDGWTDEQHQVAASYLTGPPSLASRVALLGQGACDCNTKSPDVHMHLPTCRYRQVMELADAVEELET